MSTLILLIICGPEVKRIEASILTTSMIGLHSTIPILQVSENDWIAQNPCKLCTLNDWLYALQMLLDLRRTSVEDFFLLINTSAS